MPKLKTYCSELKHTHKGGQKEKIKDWINKQKAQKHIEHETWNTEQHRAGQIDKQEEIE